MMNSTSWQEYTKPTITKFDISLFSNNGNALVIDDDGSVSSTSDIKKATRFILQEYVSCADMRRSLSLYLKPKKESGAQDSPNTRRGTEAGRGAEAEAGTETGTETGTEAGESEEELIALQYVETEPKFNKRPKFNTSGSSYHMIYVDDDAMNNYSNSDHDPDYTKISELVLKCTCYNDETKDHTCYALDDYGDGQVVWWSMNKGEGYPKFTPKKNQVWNVKYLS